MKNVFKKWFVSKKEHDEALERIKELKLRLIDMTMNCHKSENIDNINVNQLLENFDNFKKRSKFYKYSLVMSPRAYDNRRKNGAFLEAEWRVSPKIFNDETEVKKVGAIFGMDIIIDKNISGWYIRGEK